VADNRRSQSANAVAILGQHGDIEVGMIDKMIAATGPNSEATASDLRDIVAAIAKQTADRDRARDELARIPAAREALLLVDDHKSLDRLDEKEKLHQRTCRKAALIVPQLTAQRDAATRKVEEQKIAEYRASAHGHFLRIEKAFENFIAANEEAIESHVDAINSLGNVARVGVPVTWWSLATRELLAAWRRSIESQFTPRQAATVPDRYLVKFVNVWSPFQPGDVGTVDRDTAYHLRDKGFAQIIDATIPPPRVYPRMAPTPAPGPDGRVAILFVRSRGIPTDDGGPASYQAGDVARFPPTLAAKIVRDGLAEFFDDGALFPEPDKEPEA
jgi:hypothetical protein